MVQKPDGTWQLCVDYRGLDGVTTSDPYPLPNINDCLEKVRDVTIFPTLDLIAGYWQIPTSPSAAGKLAFSTDQCQFIWTVMPFGAKTAPAVFQGLMNMVLRGLQWDRVVCYFDNILIGTSTWKKYWEKFELVLACLERAGLRVKAAKVQLGKPDVDFLVHIVGNGLLKPNAKNRRAIQEICLPSSKEAERLYGLFSYYLKFIDNFAHVLSPECTLSLPDTRPNALPSVVETDASDNQLGAVLMQTQRDGFERPIAFCSRTLSAQQRNYQTREKRCLAQWKLSITGVCIYLGNNLSGKQIMKHLSGRVHYGTRAERFSVG